MVPLAYSLRTEPSPVELDQLLDQRQPNASARVFARCAAVGLAEPIEDVGQLVGANADPAIGDQDHQRVGVNLRSQLDEPLIRELVSVRQEIEDHLV